MMQPTNMVSLFSTPVYEEVIVDDDFTKIQKEIQSGLETTVFNKPDSVLGHYICNSRFDGDWMSDKKCLKFISRLNDAILKYCDGIGMDSTKIDYDRKSWINLFEKQNYAHIHEHGGNDISGVYYCKTTGADGNLFFETPISQTSSIPAWTNLSKRIAVIPCVGKLVLFPSWLRHGVNQNFTNDKRVSISWNIKLKLQEQYKDDK
tara:strand:+ start:1736 stop:2350 length:615 start_codon:yes stop_codon:yes gene_type:complete